MAPTSTRAAGGVEVTTRSCVLIKYEAFQPESRWAFREDMNRRGRDPGRQDSPPKTRATCLQGIKRLLHTQMLSLQAQPTYHSSQHKAHLVMTRLTAKQPFVGFMSAFLFRRILLGHSTPGDSSPYMDLERGGQIAGPQRHPPLKTVHRSCRDEHPLLFSLLWPVR